MSILDERSVSRALDAASTKAQAGSALDRAGSSRLRGESVSLLINDLLLDPLNPRIEPREAQLEVRQSIIDDQGSKLAELCQDIVDNGLNPMDRILVLRPDAPSGGYVALEGNRRVAALQMLNNPTLLNDIDIPDLLRDRFVALSDRFDPADVEPISAVLMPDRDSAQRWILLRHTGQNSGRGIVDWTGVQTARFRGDRTLQLVDYVKDKADLTDAERRKITTDFPITTLDRLISNPVLRQKIGLQIQDGDFYLTYDPSQVLRTLKFLVMELAEGRLSVSRVKNREQQLAYFDSLPSGTLPDGPRLVVPRQLQAILNERPPPPPPPPSPPTVSPLDRKTLAPKGFALSIPNQKADQLFFELKALNVQRFPIASAITLRSFVEATVDVYLTKIGKPLVHTDGRRGGQALSLAEKVELTLQELSSMLKGQELRAVRLALTDARSVISVSRLNEYVHNPAVFPSRSDLVSSWSGLEPFFRTIWK